MSRVGIRRRRRGFGLFSLLALLALSLSFTGAAQEMEDGRPHAGLVVVGEEGGVSTYCVVFDAEELSGRELLRRAGLSVTTSAGSTGSAVCALGDQGCPASDCFCACKGAPCAYWSYFHREADGSWAYSGVGVDAWTLRDGDVDAWVWGDGSVRPPEITFVEICGDADAPPASTLRAEGVASPLPTPTTEATTQVFLPGVGGAPRTSQPHSGWLPPAVQHFLDGYGSFVLLLLALLALALLRRGKREE